MNYPSVTPTPSSDPETVPAPNEEEALVREWWQGLSQRQKQAVQELYASIAREAEAKTVDGETGTEGTEGIEAA